MKLSSLNQKIMKKIKTVMLFVGDATEKAIHAVANKEKAALKEAPVKAAS